MFFNSLTFALFLPTVLCLFWVIPRSWRTGLLVLASYFFYGWWDVRFLSLILISTVVDFLAGKRIYLSLSQRTRRRWLWMSLLVNLGILGFFKYWGFFVDSAASLLTSLGADPGVSTLRLVLPVGISFYTFQTLSYTVDIYRREMEPEPSFLRFALFVSFFPQLVAGPIERARRLLPQLRSFPDRVAEVDWSGSASLIFRGLFRKVVIADGVAPLVNEVFSKPGVYGGISVAMAVVGFSLQIYGDFAGYTDIARGVARLFGVDLMINFKAPYRARGFSDFWRRWHISLSTWLRDYLYIPLGGNRRGPVRTYVNLMATMVIGGLWHGAGWGFVLWGGLHGFYLLAERWYATRRGARQTPSLPIAFVFIVVSLTWVPFRAPSAGAGLDLLAALFSLEGSNIAIAPITVGVLAILTMLIDDFDERGVMDPAARAPAYARGLVYGVGIVAALFFASQSAIPFIYFQF
jgi:D-alanyl-lipoteichoic acid acyltransferase DltB (MBOAT superfamily)